MQELTSRYSQSFIPFFGKLWSSLPVSVFPTSHDLISFIQEGSFKTFVPILWRLATEWAFFLYIFVALDQSFSLT
ncbi:hypothetical protein E2C01_084885 [Portunus trituberculatus]|uniref:Uncharacterized protein n=1 Tax=Portunus trituberculatus TaxID=210409 RepID=A0A5B7J156_PORTR|nr:hypothetical protein [Portunus trituberculatus]